MARVLSKGWGKTRQAAPWVRFAVVWSVAPLVLAIAVGATQIVAAADSLRLDDFTKTYHPNKLPTGWKDKLNLTGFQFVHDGEEEHYIHMETDADGSGLLGYEGGFQIEDWHFLEWEWRVTVLPTGGDVRDKNANDQAGNMCVAYDPGWIAFDKYLCYLFENNGPIGTEGTASTNEDFKYIILRAADTHQIGQWYTERVNIYEDFKRLWGEEPSAEATIGLFVDSDDTKTSAEVFYRHIYLRKH